MHSFLLAAAALPLAALAAPTGTKVSSLAGRDNVTQQNFDYIIVGGGLTGLTVASRLSEDSSINVLVIEGGQDNHNDPRVYDVRTYGEAFESDIDYNLTSTPISWRNGTQLPMAAGKTLGGSGSINGASWTKGPKTQYNLLPELVGDDSWGWEGLNEYMLSAEHFYPPAENLEAKGAAYDLDVHGRNGSVQVSFAQGIFGSIQLPALNASGSVWKGLRRVSDVASGVVNGFTTIPNMVQPDVSQNRSSPFTAWISGEPETRENLVILTGHRVTKIKWNNTCLSTDDGCELTAAGVYYQASRDSERLFVPASREVLLAAGSMQSPQVLELSGVGDPDVLSSAGICVQLALKGVGKNLQEQTKSSLQYTPESVNFNGSGPSTAIAFPNVQQILGENSSAVYADVMAGLSEHANKLEADGVVVNASATLEILTLQVQNIFNHSEAAVEIFYTLSTTDETVGADIWNLIVLSRGSIHIQSNNSWDHPAIDPNYFGHPLDLQLQTLAAKQTREVYQSEQVSSYIVEETTPGLSTVPQNASYSVWEDWVKDTFTSVWHPVATLSMMKKEFGGVVNNRLQVYGTSNVRVIDASVLPIQLSAHLSSSLYGIALKAAAMIRADQIITNAGEGRDRQC